MERMGTTKNFQLAGFGWRDFEAVKLRQLHSIRAQSFATVLGSKKNSLNFSYSSCQRETLSKGTQLLLL